ncbi:hypothetical protein Bca4012_021764 [Brassica carinata]
MSRSRDGYVSKWISNAVERGVLEVNIRLMTTSKLYLTYELLTSKLVKLTLGTQMSLEKLPPDVPLPALKRLFVDTVVFTFEDLCDVLLPGCPVLEELGYTSFDAPNLISLEYADYALAMYPQVNMKSLVEAMLDIHYSKLMKRPDLTGLVIARDDQP